MNLSQIAQQLDVSEDRLKEWVECVFPERESPVTFEEVDVERLRVARNLLEDLEVNLEGVEVILGMRDRMIAMGGWMHQVFEILDQHKLLSEELVSEFKELSKHG